jgi:hypothetical protein
LGVRWAVHAVVGQSLSVNTALGDKRVAPGDVDAALEQLRTVVVTARFPFDLPGAVPARDGAKTLLAQLDDYLIPRLRHLDAPLLAVLGGSTGAGKSTLVNSLIRAPISKTGALRPTTRAPVLVCHPDDGAWFGERSLLSGLARSTHPGEDLLQVVSAPLLRPGLALLDAPDINSVVAANRELGQELLDAADLWLFVTTAARYADAVPWQVLRGARDRGTVVAIVLDRVPPEARQVIADDLRRMLREQDLGAAPLFVVNESTLDGHGLIAELEVAPIKSWLDMVASSANQRRGVTRRTLLGAVTAAAGRADVLAEAADDQTNAAASLAPVPREAYGRAMSDVEGHIRGGSALRGEGYVRWQELVATGDLERALRRRDPGTAGVAGTAFMAATVGMLTSLVVEAGTSAAEDVAHRWRMEPAGRQLLATDETLGRPGAGFGDAAHDLVHGWQVELRERSSGNGAVELLALIATVAPPAGEITADGSVADMLRAVMGDPVAATLGGQARSELLFRIGELFAGEVDSRLAAIEALDIDPGLGGRLREHGAQVGVARHLYTAMSEAA